MKTSHYGYGQWGYSHHGRDRSASAGHHGGFKTQDFSSVRHTRQSDDAEESRRSWKSRESDETRRATRSREDDDDDRKTGRSRESDESRISS